MKPIKNRLVVAMAIVGVCALLYIGWLIFQQKIAADQSRAFFSATPSAGIPNLYRDAPPPKQP